MSRIEPKKGLNLLLEALESLVKAGINFHFVLAGSNPQDPNYEKQILAQIEQSSFSRQTTVTGFVKDELKLGLLQDADLFVLPSYYENFGIAVAEAMALGTPVVISDQVYIWPDVQQASAGWVTHLDVDALSETLKMALDSIEERKQRGDNARRLVREKYDWQAIAQQTIQMYQNVFSVT